MSHSRENQDSYKLAGIMRMQWLPWRPPPAGTALRAPAGMGQCAFGQQVGKTPTLTAS